MAQHTRDTVQNQDFNDKQKSSQGMSVFREAFQNSDEFRAFIQALGWKMNEFDQYKKNFSNQGAVPKTRNFDENNYRRNPYRWYKNEKRNDNKKQQRNENTVAENGKKTTSEMITLADTPCSSSMVSLNSEGDQSSIRKNPPFPFYYVVPENPSLVNVLRPGTYLVIPQSKMSNRPLAVVRHPTAKESERNDDKSMKNPTRRNKMGGTNKLGNAKNNGGVKLQQTTEQGPSCSSEENDTKRTHVSVEALQGESEENSSKAEDSRTCESEKNFDDSEGRLPDFQLATLLTELPYFDEKYLMREWSQKENGQTLDMFVEEMRERRTNEVYNRILTNVPRISPKLLREKISEIMDSDEAVQDFIEMENFRATEADLQKLKQIFTGYEDKEIISTYLSLKDTVKFGDDEEMFRVVRDELKIRKKEEQMMQQLQMISAMLPDVDTNYVMDRLNDIDGNSIQLNKFIETLLERPNYPKAAEFDPISREKQKLWHYYVTGYSPATYLKKVPDPENFFSGSSVRDHKISRECAIKFLEFRYPDLDNFQLNDVFTNSDESLLKTCKILDKNYLPEITLDESLKSRQWTEAFLQEVMFIIKKDEILKYLIEEKERRLFEIQRAEEENAFFECLVCYDSNVIPSEAVVCPEGHIICRNCLVAYTQTLFSEGKCLFPCLSGTCDTEYTLKTLEKSLDAKLFSKITQRRAAEDVDKAGVPGLEKCPSCDFAFIPAPDDKLFRCLNEDCMRVTCRLCKEDNHIPLSCKEVERPKDLLARQQVEEAMTKQLIRCCPNCSKKFIKIDGCNKITCPCGVIMCYVCSQIVKDYKHFNGLGGMEFKKCPLYSENRKLHVVDVIQAGIREKEKIKRNDPNVNFVFDPTEANESN